MYWFNIFYYENTPEEYVIPVIDIDNNPLMVYATNPTQASEIGMGIVESDYKYAYHLPRIGTMSSCVHADEMNRWHADHRS